MTNPFVCVPSCHAHSALLLQDSDGIFVLYKELTSTAHSTGAAQMEVVAW
jgi:hypothetical protein